MREKGDIASDSKYYLKKSVSINAELNALLSRSGKFEKAELKIAEAEPFQGQGYRGDIIRVVFLAYYEKATVYEQYYFIKNEDGNLVIGDVDIIPYAPK